MRSAPKAQAATPQTSLRFRAVMEQIVCLIALLFFIADSSARSADAYTDATAGIGVALAANGTNIVVTRIFPDSVAATEKTIHVGDRIVAVAQESEPAIEVRRLEQAIQLIRGAKGTMVSLTIFPAGQDKGNQKVVSFRRGELKELADWGDGVVLTNGMQAPNIEMIRLADSKTEQLFDYAGKVIVLEFWATWCAPCQRAMAELESLSASHSDWQDKVVIIAASVDDTADLAAKHLKQKGWNQTHNVLAGVQAKRAYHVGGIPTLYVIDRTGRIATQNPGDIETIVNQLVAESPSTNKPAHTKAEFAGTLTKEPAYQSTPKYCLLTLGDSGEVKVWMVEDGRRLFVDKNANGDLTDDGPPLEPHDVRHLDADRWDFHYVLDAITPANGPASTNFVLARWNYDGKEEGYGLSLSVNGRMPMYAGWFGTFWSTNRDDAPVIHFGGPFTPKLLRRDAFTIGENGQRLSLCFFNPGSGPGAVSRLSIDGLPHDVMPELKIEWPAADSGKPLETFHELNQRCCYWEFYTTEFEVPKGVVIGKAKVSVNLLPGAMPAALTTREFEVPVVARSPESDRAQ
jgi:thiol-disulfide isomerase/thioredoxin